MYHRICFGLAIASITSIAGCTQPAPEGYLRHCASDEDCPEGLECLAVVEAEEIRHGCSVPCEHFRDCPVVRDPHCGDLSYCADGVCWAYECD